MFYEKNASKRAINERFYEKIITFKTLRTPSFDDVSKTIL